MYTIAIVSGNGGTGRTTIAANLAAMIARRGRAVLALDFDPENMLGISLGLAANESDGLARRLTSGGRWYEAAFQNSEQVRFLPHGGLADELQREFERRLSSEEGWLRARLAEIDLPAEAVVIADTPRLPSATTRAVIDAADLAIAVLAPDTYCYARLPVLRELAGGRVPMCYAVNQFDATRRLHNDVLALLRPDLGESLIPYLIHRDEAVPEAVASNRSLAEQSPHSQAAHDLQGLASWVLARMRQAAPRSASEARAPASLGVPL